MDPAFAPALYLVGAVLLLAIAGGLVLLGSHLEGRAGAAELALERDGRRRAEAERDHRGKLLDEAKQLLADAHDDAEEAIAGRAAVDEARRGAVPGDRLDAVDRVLRAHADRRARRAAAALAAGPRPATREPGAAPALGA
jgi:hypothetical protein